MARRGDDHVTISPRELPWRIRLALPTVGALLLLLPAEGAGGARSRDGDDASRAERSVAIAVLDIAGEKAGLQRDQLESITDWVRDAAQRSVPNATVFTRENVQQLLEDNDRELARCVGDCEVETGRLLGADYIVTGVVTKFAATYVLTLKIHDTHTGRFLGAEKARAEAVDGLVDGVDRASRRLFGRVPEARAGGQPERGGASPAAVPPPPPPPATGGGRRPADELAPIAAEAGMLRVEGAPKGARVDVAGPSDFGADGAVATTLPYGPARVPAGTYRVKVSAPDHDAQQREVRVFADRTEVVRVDLAKSWGRLETAGTPAGARVDLACARNFTKSFGLGSALTVPLGDCRLVVSRDGYERFEKTVAVKGGETVRVEVALPKVRSVSRPGEVSARTGIHWVRLEGGTFEMGSVEGDDDEQPVHRVRLRSFSIARTEVTVSQYKACVSARLCSEPSTLEPCNWGQRGRDDHPVNCVDWDQARTFCAWAGGRLCSEAEWEYAARSGGQIQTHPWGYARASCARAVMDDGLVRRRVHGSALDETAGCGELRTWAVCEKPLGSSDHGVCDLAGNVWEWVGDDWHESYDGAPSDGSVWVDRPRATSRVVRGGSWRDRTSHLRAANRNHGVWSRHGSGVGFRCCR